MAFLTDEEIAATQDTLREYMKRRKMIESEIMILREDIKTLDDEFKDKLDLKTFKLAQAVIKAKAKVAHKFTFDNFVDVMEQEGWGERE
jgi:uncharacterized protein (DUF927 family)